MITTINQYKLIENINSINYTIKYEDWGYDNKIILRNEESPNQKLIGLLIYTIDKKTQKIHIETITTMRYYKRMGFGKFMFDLLLNVAKEKNVKTITLTASPLRDDVNVNILVDMYTKWGFKTTFENNILKTVDMIYTL